MGSRATRRVDTYHAVQRATNLLDEAGRLAWKEAAAKAKAAPKRGKGRPRKGEAANPNAC